MALTNGVYVIVSYLNPDLCTDNSYFSTEKFNPQFLCGYAGTENQKMIVKDPETGTAGENSVKIQNSGQYWYCNSAKAVDNQSLKQYPKGQGATNEELSWLFEDTGKTLTVNGNALKVYYIIWDKNKSYAINYKDSLASYLNALKMTTITTESQQYQWWVPIKSVQYDKNMSAPAITITGEKNSTVSAKLNTPTVKNIKFSNGSKFQYRVKRSFLLHNTTTWADDPLYYSPTNATTDFGYGNVWTNNAVASNNYTMESANSSPTLWTVPYDSVKYTFEARQFSSNTYGAIGGVIQYKTYSTSQLLTVSIDAVVISANGLVVDFTTDAYRVVDGGALSVDIKQGGKTILNSVVKKNITLKEKALVINYEKVKTLPGVGSSVAVTLSFSSNSKYIESFNATKTVTVTAQGGTLVPKLTISRTKFDVNIAVSEKSAKAFNVVYLSMIYQHDGKIIIRKIIDGKNTRKTLLACPFNKEYSLFCLLVNTDSTGATNDWGSTTTTDIHKVVGTAVVNTYSCELPLLCGESENEDIFKKHSTMTSSEVIFNGSLYKSKFNEENIPTDASLTNVMLTNDNKWMIDIVKKEFYCLLRTSKGEYLNCCINDVSFDKYCNGYDVISVTFDEVDRDVDVVLEG